MQLHRLRAITMFRFPRKTRLFVVTIEYEHVSFEISRRLHSATGLNDKFTISGRFLEKK